MLQISHIQKSENRGNSRWPFSSYHGFERENQENYQDSQGKQNINEKEQAQIQLESCFLQFLFADVAVIQVL